MSNESATYHLHVDRGNTAIFSGEGDVEILSGEVDIFGSDEIRSFHIYPSKAIPVYVKREASFRVSGSSTMVVKGDPIPSDWRVTVKEDISSGAMRISTIGGVDTGKTGLITYIVNFLVSNGEKVAIIDCDTGQSDIGLPTSIGLGYVDRPIASLLDIKPYKEYFIGLTSPRKLFHRVLSGLYKLLNLALEDGYRYILLNTTGWIYGEGLRELKHRKFELFKPDVIYVVEDDLSYQYLSTFHKVKKVSKPSFILPRSMDVRHGYRSWKYREYFTKDIKEVELKISELRFVGGYLFTGRSIKDMVGIRDDVYIEDIGDKYIIIGDMKLDGLNLGKEILKISKEDLIGLMLGFIDKEGFVVGYGIISDIDPNRDIIRILTPIEKDKINIVHWGYIKLDLESFDEMGWVEPLTI